MLSLGEHTAKKQWYEKIPVLTGLSLKCWVNLLLKGGIRLFDMHFIIKNSLMIMCLAPLRVHESFKLRKVIAKTQIDKPPIFIIGCFRSGTTHLHNLLSQSDTFGYINTVEAGAFPYADLFATPGSFLNKTLRKIEMKRPMDNLVYSTKYPQEEEMALGSYYPWSVGPAFCSEKYLKLYIDKYLLLSDNKGKYIKNWKSSYLYVLKKITVLRQGKQLLLKNPPNTARIKWLLELFPEAKFIHIYRNPYEVFVSNVHLWKSMWQFSGVKNFDSEKLEEMVLKLYCRLMEAFFDQKDLIPSANLVQVSYEDLVKSPMVEVKRIFHSLHIDYSPEQMQSIKNYIDSQADYKTNKFSLNQETIDKIYQHWHFTIDKWGYNPCLTTIEQKGG